MWLEKPENAQDLSEVDGILELMQNVQATTEAKEQDATTALENYGKVYLPGDVSQAANILNYVLIGIAIPILLAAIIYLRKKKK